MLKVSGVWSIIKQPMARGQEGRHGDGVKGQGHWSGQGCVRFKGHGDRDQWVVTICVLNFFNSEIMFHPCNYIFIIYMYRKCMN